MAKKTGRPPIQIDLPKLKALMRLKPTLEDTAAFFECSPDTIEKVIRSSFNLRFTEFREQNMVHTRLNLIRRAIEKAERGDNVMLIFTLKNLCGWKDKWDNDPVIHNNIQVDSTLMGLVDKVLESAKRERKK